MPFMAAETKRTLRSTALAGTGLLPGFLLPPLSAGQVRPPSALLLSKGLLTTLHTQFGEHPSVWTSECVGVLSKDQSYFPVCTDFAVLETASCGGTIKNKCSVFQLLAPAKRFP